MEAYRAGEVCCAQQVQAGHQTVQVGCDVHSCGSGPNSRSCPGCPGRLAITWAQDLLNENLWRYCLEIFM